MKKRISRRISKLLILVMLPVVTFLTLGIFLASGFVSGYSTAFALGNGGCYYVGTNSSLTISFSSKISGGVAEYGGGVYIEDGGKFTMNGGSIYGNTANYGGGVYIENGGNFTMNDGIIGGIVEFGSYPQTIKSDDVTIDESTVDSNGYYTGSDGNKYAKLSANTLGLSSVFSDGESIVYSKTYYFKVEPLKWRVLTDEYVYDDEGNKGVLLLCEEIIDVGYKFGQKFTNSTTTNPDSIIQVPGIEMEEYEANNYKKSFMRTWLNGTSKYYGDGTYNSYSFYGRAFSSSEKDLIIQTSVDNTSSTTNGVSESLCCENTDDKVFLLSYQDMLNTAYGFDSYTMREKRTTDFARASGLKTEENGGGSWWLRSNAVATTEISSSVAVSGVNSSGVLTTFNANSGKNGIVPAIVVSSSAISSQSSLKANIYNKYSTTIYGGIIYGDIYSAYGDLSLNGGILNGDIDNNRILYISGGTVNGDIDNDGYFKISKGVVNGDVDSHYTDSKIVTTPQATINGTINLGENGTIVVNDYDGTTPSYNIVISPSRAYGTILTFNGSATKPDSSKVTITGVDDSVTSEIEYTYYSSTNQWVVNLVPRKYTLTINKDSSVSSFSIDGNTYSSTTSVSCDYGSDVTISVSPDVGYHGCWIEGVSTTLANSYTVNITGDRTFTVKVAVNTYSVKYYGNGETGGSTASSTHTFGVLKQLTENDFEKTDYIFVGWSTEPGTNTKVSFPYSEASAVRVGGTGEYSNLIADEAWVKNLTASHGGTVELYARWKLDTCTVTFDANGGYLSTTEYTVTRGAKLSSIFSSELPTPERLNYIFKGWYTSSSGGDEVTLDTVVNEDVPFYAQWKKPSVTLNANGGNFNDTDLTGWSQNALDDDIKIISGTVNLNTSTSTFPKPSRDNYNFDGWYDSASGGNQVLSVADDNVVLYAHWTPKTTTVSFDQNGGTGGQTSSITMTYGQQYSSTVSTPTKGNMYIFDGYYYNDTQYFDDSGNPCRTWNRTNSTITLTAKWIEKSYLRVNASGTESSTGDYAFFGFYPQSVADSSVVSALKNNSDGDYTYQGYKYRVYNGSVYKFEPIKWRIIYESGNDMILVADQILDVSQFNSSSSEYFAIFYYYYQSIETNHTSTLRKNTYKIYSDDNVSNKVELIGDSGKYNMIYYIKDGIYQGDTAYSFQLNWIWAPSLDDFKNISYQYTGNINKTSLSATAYAEAVATKNGGSTSTYWTSTGYYTGSGQLLSGQSNAFYVTISSGNYVNYSTVTAYRGVVPMLKLNLATLLDCGHGLDYEAYSDNYQEEIFEEIKNNTGYYKRYTGFYCEACGKDMTQTKLIHTHTYSKGYTPGDGITHTFYENVDCSKCNYHFNNSETQSCAGVGCRCGYSTLTPLPATFTLMSYVDCSNCTEMTICNQDVLLDDKKKYSSEVVLEEKRYSKDVVQLPKIS